MQENEITKPFLLKPFLFGPPDLYPFPLKVADPPSVWRTVLSKSLPIASNRKLVSIIDLTKEIVTYFRPKSQIRRQFGGHISVAAPTDYWVKERQGISPAMFFPSSNGLRKAERAFYEYLGLAWARIRGQI